MAGAERVLINQHTARRLQTKIFITERKQKNERKDYCNRGNETGKRMV